MPKDKYGNVFANDGTTDMRWNASIKEANAKAKKNPYDFVHHIRKQPKPDPDHYIDNADQYRAWLSALLPKSGVVNDFRDRMYQNELRAVSNRANVVQGQGRRMMERGTAEFHAIARARPLTPGIQLFYQNTVDKSPLPGRSVRGGAVMTPVERNPAVNARTNAKIDDLLKARADQITSFRNQRQEVPIPSLITIGDDAKYQLAVALQTIGNNIQNEVYDKDMLRNLQSLALTLARNVVLLDHDTLMEFYKFVGDHRRMMAQNTKNIARELGAEVQDDEAHYGRYNPQEQLREYTTLKSNIYEKLGQIQNFLQLNAEASTRPDNERVAIARTALKTLDVNLDKTKYTTYARDLLSQSRREEEEARRIQQAQADLGGVNLGQDVIELVGEMPMGMRVGDPVYNRVILAIEEGYQELDDGDFEVLDDEAPNLYPQVAINAGNYGEDEAPPIVIRPPAGYAQPQIGEEAPPGADPALVVQEAGVQAGDGQGYRLNMDEVNEIIHAIISDNEGNADLTVDTRVSLGPDSAFRGVVNRLAREHGNRGYPVLKSQKEKDGRPKTARIGTVALKLDQAGFYHVDDGGQRYSMKDILR